MGQELRLVEEGGRAGVGADESRSGRSGEDKVWVHNVQIGGGARMSLQVNSTT